MDYHLSSNLLRREQCPVCARSGGDTSGDNLGVFDDDHKYCFSCGHLEFLTSSSQSKARIKQQITSYQVLPMHTVEAILNKRGISNEVIKRYGVKCEQQEDGRLCVAFPLADVNGSIYTKHYRGVDTSTGTLTRDMWFDKGRKLKLPLFGWQLVKKQQTLVICEGETDALITASRLSGRSDVVVVGLVGTANAERLAAHLVSYAGNRRIVLCLDNDSAGQQALEKIVNYCDKHDSELKLHKLTFPADYNDVGDWLTADTEVDIYQAITEAQPVAITGLLDADQIADSLEAYIHKLRSHALVELQFSPTLSECIRLLPGKLIGIAGDAGMGKSTLVEHVAMEALTQKFNVLFASQEMSPAEVALKLVRMVRNEPLDNPRYLRTLDDATIVDIKNQIKRVTRLLKTTDGFGKLSVDELDKRIHKCVGFGSHPDIVIVDNLFAISETLEANAIIDLCYRLKQLAVNHETCVILLTHVRKGQSGRGIYRPGLSDIYGSSGLQASADSIIAVASDKQKRETYVETVKVERMGGGYADVTLAYQDYCLHEVDDDGSTFYPDDSEQEYEEQEVY